MSRARYTALSEALGRIDPARATLLLTGLLLVLYGSDDPLSSVLVRVLGILAIFLIDHQRLSQVVWFAIASVLTISHIGRIYTVDNHKVLLAYWTIAIALSPPTQRGGFLATNARLLICGVFVAATAWKCASGDFLNGSFMTFTLLLDSRFAAFTSWTTGVDAAALFENTLQLRRVINHEVSAAELLSGERVQFIANALTWYTLAVEGSVALAFLVPRTSLLGRIRNALLIVFIATVYSVATVIGFAWTLSILGYVQCAVSEKRSRVAFLLCFMLTQFYLVPWRWIVA
jgi:hypothetical protein